MQPIWLITKLWLIGNSILNIKIQFAIFFIYPILKISCFTIILKNIVNQLFLGIESNYSTDFNPYAFVIKCLKQISFHLKLVDFVDALFSYLYWDEK